MNKQTDRFTAICLRPSPLRRARQARTAERGVALVITLLFLSLITVLSLGMVIALSSQTLIGGYYRNYRASFYAADSGLNIARQQLQAQILAGVPTTWSNPPIADPVALASTASSAINSSYGSSTTLNAGTAGTSWAEKFQVTNVTFALAPNSPQITGNNTSSGGCTPVIPCPTGFQYVYNYSLTVVGAAQGSEQQTVTESGTITMNVTGQSGSSSQAFSFFGAFVDDYPPGIGPLVPGTMTGPMFTNQSWEFMANQPPWTSPYIFTDPLGQVGGSVDYWDTGWGQHWVAGPSYGSGANLIAPSFEGGLYLNQNPVAEPTNTFNQEEAVIDGNGQSMTPAQTTAALTTLQNVAGQSYAGGQGVYMKSSTTCGTVTPPCMAGGGFYVEGAADVQLIPSGATAQEYIITQGTTVTTITITPPSGTSAGTTVISNGTTSETLNGVPMNTIASQAETEVYVDGTVTIHGPGEGQGAVQDNAMIGVTANGDIIATGDVLYKTEPVTIPQDALIPSAEGMNQVLGLFTATGNFITQDAQADQNIEVDASIATISQADINNGCSGQGGQLSYGHINTFNNVGGMAQSCIYAADVNTENTWFDRRFTSRPNFAPPWFPSTTVTTGGPLPVNSQLQIQRVQWLSTSSD